MVMCALQLGKADTQQCLAAAVGRNGGTHAGRCGAGGAGEERPSAPLVLSFGYIMPVRRSDDARRGHLAGAVVVRA